MRKFIAVTILLTGFAFPALAETVHVGVDGMVCAFCAVGIKKNFKKDPATDKVDVDLDNGLVTIKTKPQQKISDASIQKVITDAGFKVTSIHHME
jgi:copper chaperone CopZ